MNQQNANDFWLVIGTFAAVGVTALGIFVSSWLQHRQIKLNALLEAFKILTTEPAPTHRKIIYNEFSQRQKGDAYDSNQDTLRTARLDTTRIFDHIGALVKEGLIPKQALLNVYWDVIILSWDALEGFISFEGKLRGINSHMEDFRYLYELAKNIRKNFTRTNRLDLIMLPNSHLGRAAP